MAGLTQLRATWAPRLLSVLRIVTALLFLEHGSSKLLHFPHIAALDNLPLLSMAGFSGGLELIGGALLVLGPFSVPVAFILSGEMAVAYFLAHNGRAFFPLLNGGEAAILFCFVFLYIAAAGPGPWSVDAGRK